METNKDAVKPLTDAKWSPDSKITLRSSNYSKWILFSIFDETKNEESNFKIHVITSGEDKHEQPPTKLLISFTLAA